MNLSGDEMEGVHSIGAEDEATEVIESEDHETKEAPSATLFIRNLPFTCTDELLHSHFSQFGSVRYARVVFDPETERCTGTGFVCFFNEGAAKSCVKNAPKHASTLPSGDDKKRKGETLTHSVLQNETVDPTGRYTIEGLVLQV